MKKAVFPILWFCLAYFSGYGQKYTYSYTPGCRDAYKQYMSLHLNAGNAAIREEIMANPTNLMATFIADYEDCLLLLFNGNKTDYEQRKGHMDDRLRLLERGDAKSPWHRLCKAGIYMHWAAVSLRQGDNLKAGLHFRKSFQLLKENRKLFPSFEYNDIYWGVETAAVGAIPDDYKWIVSIFGMHGNVKQGLDYLSRFVNTHTYDDFMKYEAAIYYAYFGFYLGHRQEEVWNYVNSAAFPTNENLMNLFVKTNLALNYRKADVAIQTSLQAQKDENYKLFPILDFEYASALFHKLNNNSLVYFNRFLSRYKGGFFVKESLQRMALIYYLQGNMRDAVATRERIKREGGTAVDADKQALRFAQEEGWPDKTLLQARLLIDGGFHKNALERLKAKSENDFTAISDKLEYNFRLGRAYDEAGDDEKALQYYNNVIRVGKTRKEHFAARSALQIGFIYEKRGSNAKAIAAYNNCLAMRNHDFQNSIDQQAKAGINRLQ